MIKITPVDLTKLIEGISFKQHYLCLVKEAIKDEIRLYFYRFSTNKLIEFSEDNLTTENHTLFSEKVRSGEIKFKKNSLDQLEEMLVEHIYTKIEGIIADIVEYYLNITNINIDEFLLFDIIKIKKLSDKIIVNPERYEENKDVLKILYDSYDKLRDGDIEGKKFSYRLVESMGIVVCPYCNRNYINVGSENETAFIGAQLDHFIPRSKYPIFAVSIYNLIPSCGTCNKLKLENIFSCSPYDQSECVNRPKVIIDLTQPEGFRIDPGNFKDQFEILKLGAAYKIHKQDYKELETRARVYNESQIEEIEELLGLKYQGISYDEFIFGKQYSEMEDHKHPLSKFNRDIVNELKEIISRSR